MTDKKLAQLLEELHAALDATEAVDEKGRELLRALNEDINELLERSDDAQSDDSLLGRMQETMTYFERTHPEMASALSNLLTTLSNAGI
ncbi:MAG: DUF4404 family protein [Anaerolineaceae bacterium]|jgi:hypothetical protein|nr:DUF4404 family protein [Anaerolineaceae bacterium]OQY87383.1 MAG: hypothetical protein B6D38_12525 [Anaerolineae bacterium UTCFX1]